MIFKMLNQYTAKYNVVRSFISDSVIEGNIVVLDLICILDNNNTLIHRLIKIHITINTKFKNPNLYIVSLISPINNHLITTLSISDILTEFEYFKLNHFDFLTIQQYLLRII